MATPRVVGGGSPERISAAFAGSLAVSIYSLMYRGADGAVLPLSSYSIGSTEAIDQATLAAVFAGVSQQARNAGDGAQTDFPVMTDVDIEIDCASSTFVSGDLVAVCRNGGGTAIENLKVKKTTSKNAAIGYVIGNYATATTRVRVRLMSSVWPHANPASAGNAAPVSVAAAGSNQGTAAALTVNTFNQVTAGDGTKGVQLPAAAPGDEVDVYTTVATNGVPVYPQTGGTINGGSANAAFTMEGKTFAKFKTYDGLNWAVIGTANT